VEKFIRYKLLLTINSGELMAMNEHASNMDDKKETLKGIVKRLHKGEDPVKIRNEFMEVIKGTTPEEISRMEQELIAEGMPADEIHRLCDVHLNVFKESLEKGESNAPEGHPIWILMEEHKKLLDFSSTLRDVTDRLKQAGEPGTVEELMEHLNHIIDHFKESESHYVREENVLFPYLEKHDITGPPSMMWMEHDQIREIKKGIYSLIESRNEMEFSDFCNKLKNGALSLEEMLSSHFYKENNILFPTSMKVIESAEWEGIIKEFDELGYCCFTPEHAREASEDVKVEDIGTVSGEINFETGNFSLVELETMLNTLPVDITFVDKNDTVRYFSDSPERIFPRTKAIIGRKVQMCHPQKSVHVVDQILDDFKAGKRNVAEFWLNLKERLIYIRYFAVRRDQEYLGCLEVSLDITDIKKIEGEKRL
jgi:PAS domain S-box-containing protein